MNLDPAEFAHRRRALLDKMAPHSVAILQAAPEQARSRDTHYPYRPDSDFYYLTGFAEPEALLVLAPGRQAGEAVLFCRPRNKERELWEGVRPARPHMTNRTGSRVTAFPSRVRCTFVCTVRRAVMHAGKCVAFRP